jgi:hypothetical protein
MPLLSQPLLRHNYGIPKKYFEARGGQHGGSADSMTSRQCAVCGRDFEPNPRVPKQFVCPDAACQRERKRIWQQQKRQADPEYRDNRRRSANEWAKRHSGYWDGYRETNPDYAESNRLQQQFRNKKRRPEIAKMDESQSPQSLAAGRYLLTRIDDIGTTKQVSWTVEIVVLSVVKTRS